MVLERDGFEVHTASSGNQALETLSKINKLNLVLLDVNMEDMTGYQFLDIVEIQNFKILQAVPIVFYTGEDEVANTEANGFIRKAGNISQFLESVHNFV
jgi:CheY-like chemotaxis protein